MIFFHSSKNNQKEINSNFFTPVKYSFIVDACKSYFTKLESEYIIPKPVSSNILMLVHTEEYIRKVYQLNLSKIEKRRLGFELTDNIVDTARRSVNCTIKAMEHACTNAIGIHLGGGTHHAFSDKGEGFCVFNDIAIASNLALKNGLASSILIIDCDVHQGNGTNQIFRNEPSVFTFSIHGQRNYPLKKVAGDLDVGLPDGVFDEQYMEAVKKYVPIAIRESNPDLIFYIAGSDPYKEDKIGRMNLTKSALKERDKYVIEMVKRLNIPLTITLGGGYAKDIGDTVDIHLETVKTAVKIFNH